MGEPHLPEEPAASMTPPAAFQLGVFTIDPSTGDVQGPSGRQKLDPKVMEVFVDLARHAGQIVPREALMARLWPRAVVTDDVLTRCIYGLRRQLALAGGDKHSKDLIETMPKRGYRLNGEVTFSAVANAKTARPRPKWFYLALGAIAAAPVAFVVVVGQRFDGAPADSRSAPAALNSIAVLPFADMSADKNQEYMADGMAEELRILLAQIPDLKVIARTSSFAFKGQDVEVSEIANRLNVAHVLEGSVRTSGNRLRITAQLVRAADSTHLWSNTYDRPVDDIFAVQDEIAKAVVSELKIKLLGAAPKAKAREPKAYALFLQARDIGEQHTPLAYEQSISLYRQALELDPSYAEAWDGLANNYGYLGIDSIWRSDEAFRLASEAALRALALDPQYAQAHARLGWIAINYDRDLRSAARHLSHALVLDPNNTDIIEWAALLFRRIGHLDQAIEIGNYLVVHDPLNSDAHLELGLAHKYAGHWDAAITHYLSALALSPSAMGARGVIGEVLVLQGNPKAALAEVRFETDAAWRLHVETLAQQALGQSAASEAALAKMIESHGDKNASYIVEEAAFRGDTDRAFEWLDKAAQSRDPSLGAIPLSPFCENLHKDPRWLPYLRKNGMAPEQLAAIEFDFTLPK
jgi:TolB-like protein/DNA-binding winged helix-turn-helix (wHTH) protein/Tfp pilus assembly protein PilF